MEKLIYLDNAATTRIYPEVAKTVLEESEEDFFNPSALYKPSVALSVKIKNAREEIKAALKAPEGELYFLSGGTEADNTALFCTRKAKGSRVIVGLGEHDAIINSANQLAQQGFDVQYAPINPDGSVNVEEFEKLLNENVSLVSIMHVSNETGAINDIARLVKITKKVAPNAIFHSDGVQAFGKIKVNLRALDVDLYSISSHKIHGPKGIGGLFVKKGTSIKPLLYGGTGTFSNEVIPKVAMPESFEAGTQFSGGICALHQGAKWTFDNLAKIKKHIDRITKNIIYSLEHMGATVYTRDAETGVVSFNLKNADSGYVADKLNEVGICVRGGLHCAPLVHLNMGTTNQGAVRASVGCDTQESEISYFLSCVERIFKEVTK